MHTDMSLQGQVALVVGAGKELGRAVALGLAEAGADIAVVARTAADLDSLNDAITALDRRALRLCADATVPEQVNRIVAETLASLGHIDILVNAVGGNLRKPLTETTDAEWKTSLRFNLSSTFCTCRAVGRHMLERKCDSVINIASSAGLRGRANMSSYCATKAAVINLSRALAIEWAPAGTRVNVLCPGRFLTPATAADKAQYDAFVRKVPLGRIGQPEELKSAAVWLASAASSFATGSVSVLDGGQTVQ